MKKTYRKYLFGSLFVLILFALWTVLLKCVDVQPVGPNGSKVGFAKLNIIVHQFTGVNFTLYHITDWLGLVPLGFIIGFGVLGLCQWINRGHIGKVDPDILVLGGYYIVVLTLYILFEIFIINYRPVLIRGILEASYPSSTTLLVLCVMPASMIQLNLRINNILFRRIILVGIACFTVFMVIGRVISGVHWITDILGGIMLSCGMVLLYISVIFNLKTIAK